jgi:aspartyl-tRNA(Asn)/glutamyl-tRNA(Gln) amidotransferase subunit B
MTTTTPAARSATAYEAVIGLETHVQLLTERKMFCDCSAAYADAPPNTHVCPVCMALPGVLPVINRKAVEFTIMTGLALNCEIPAFSKFDRKNYPYPDLLKGYQISQYDLPLTKNGWVEISVESGEPKRVGITRVHLEEDTARLTHRDDGARAGTGDGYSLIDMNRAGVPLMEIVTEPDMRSPEEAREYLVKLQRVLRYIGVSNVNLEEGNFRCDANISLRPAGSSEYGAKVEIKNMNSFRAVYQALHHEIERQSRALEAGERIEQETRGWVDAEERTVSQRSKEEAHDYRYFPEPDLPPLTLDAAYVDRLRARLPELPDVKFARFQSEYGLPAYEANLLVESRAKADYYERAVAPARSTEGETFRRYSKLLANWMVGDLARLLNATDTDIADARIAPESLYAMISLIEGGTITGATAKTVFEEMFRTGREPAAIVEELGLEQIGGQDEISEICDRVIAASAKAVADYRAGKLEAIKFLVGQVMRESKGRAAPETVTQVLKEKLEGEN